MRPLRAAHAHTALRERKRRSVGRVPLLLDELEARALPSLRHLSCSRAVFNSHVLGCICHFKRGDASGVCIGLEHLTSSTQQPMLDTRRRAPPFPSHFPKGVTNSTSAVILNDLVRVRAG